MSGNTAGMPISSLSVPTPSTSMPAGRAEGVTSQAPPSTNSPHIGAEAWDLLVVGGGTAGLVGARTAASFGARVLLVERDRTGGDCLWTGCVPSKSLLAAAAAAAGARTATRFGIHVSDVRVDFNEVMGHVRAAIESIAPTDSAAALEAAGVQVATGTLTFTGAHTADIATPAAANADSATANADRATPDSATADSATADTANTAVRAVTFAQALIATGAAPDIPPIDGLGSARALTSETVWNLTSLPSRLVVLGGGSIGCELAQAFARLGSQVTIIEGAERILPREDPAASALVTTALKAEGVRVLTGVPVVAVHATAPVEANGAPGSSEPDSNDPVGNETGSKATATFHAQELGVPPMPNSGGRLSLEDGSQVDYEELLVAVGRAPRTGGLGLTAAGVDIDHRGFVVVDRHLRTTNHRIWAAGDLTAHPQFTHTAGVHASMAASNAILGLRRTVDTASIPRVTFTHPEVAAVGVTTDRAQVREGRKLLEWRHEHVDRAVTEGATEGFTRLVVDGKGKILGATVVGPRAGETLGELTLAIRHGLRTRHIAATTHAYPTYNDGLWNAAIGDVFSRLNAPEKARATRALAGLRRRWVRRRL